MRKKAIFFPVLFIFVGFMVTGCASILVKETRSFKTTRLFENPCSKEERDQFSKKFAEIEKDEQAGKNSGCRVPDIEFMVRRFLSIRETETIRESMAIKEVPGDTIEQVRDKGFKIYLDEEKGLRVPNTKALFGDEALAALGMSVGGGTRGQDAESTANFKGRHYGEMYEQEDMLGVVDRICINTRNKLEKGNVYTFVIVWRDGNVLRRIIKGGSIDHPTSEHAFMLCPGDALAGGIGKGAEIGIKAVIP